MKAKYRAFANGLSYVTIPKKIAELYGWEDKCEIDLEKMKNAEGKEGFFITKMEIEKEQPDPVL